ncbi:MAG: hypothetical protein SGILL_005462 [Bacillariaceae sp.]
MQYEEEEPEHEMGYAQLATSSSHSSRSSALEHQEQQSSPASPVQSIWKTSAPTLVESSTLETFAFDTPSVERVQILLKKGKRHGRKTDSSNAASLQAHIDVWHGPDSTPQNVAIYLEDDDDDDDEEDDDLVFMGGDDDEQEENEEDDDTTNFSAIIQTPQGYNTIAVRNTAPNHDLLACVEGEEEDPSDADTNGRPHYHMGGNPSGYYYDEPLIKPETISRRDKSSSERDAADTVNDSNGSPLQSVIDRLMATSMPQLVEGKASSDRNSAAIDVDKGQQIRTDVHTVALASNVASVQVLLRSDFMHPLQARVELILKEQGSDGGPGKVVKRTIVEVFSEDGMHRPFFAVLETPRKRKRKNKRGSSDDDDDTKKYSVSMRVINCSGSDFPLYASVEPYIIDTSSKEKQSQEPDADSSVEDNCGPSDAHGEGEKKEEYCNETDEARFDEAEGENILDDDWWEESMEKAHFGGGSHYDMSTNSTIIDAEVL